jgi:hypothetical protein
MPARCRGTSRERCIQPEDDQLLRLRQGSSGVLFEPPALDVVDVRGARSSEKVILPEREVAQPVVGDARASSSAAWRLGETQEQAAHVFQRVRGAACELAVATSGGEGTFAIEYAR